MCHDDVVFFRTAVLISTQIPRHLRVELLHFRHGSSVKKMSRNVLWKSLVKSMKSGGSSVKLA